MLIMGTIISLKKSKQRVDVPALDVNSQRENGDLKHKIAQLESELQRVLQKQTEHDSELRAENEHLKRTNADLVKELESVKSGLNQSAQSNRHTSATEKTSTKRERRSQFTQPMNEIEAYGKGLNPHELYGFEGSPNIGRVKKHGNRRRESSCGDGTDNTQNPTKSKSTTNSVMTDNGNVSPVMSNHDNQTQKEGVTEK